MSFSRIKSDFNHNFNNIKIHFFAHTFEQKDSQEKKLNDTTGELTLTNILITHGKQHYLLHPLFETFIKVNILTYT